MILTVPSKGTWISSSGSSSLLCRGGIDSSSLSAQGRKTRLALPASASFKAVTWRATNSTFNQLFIFWDNKSQGSSLLCRGEIDLSSLSARCQNTRLALPGSASFKAVTWRAKNSTLNQLFIFWDDKSWWSSLLCRGEIDFSSLAARGQNTGLALPASASFKAVTWRAKKNMFNLLFIFWDDKSVWSSLLCRGEIDLSSLSARRQNTRLALPAFASFKAVTRRAKTSTLSCSQGWLCCISIRKVWDAILV